MYTVDDFNKAYKVVFDADGNIQACGRNACKTLIGIAENISGNKGDYGSFDTGYMQVESIKQLYNKLNA